MKWSEEEIKFLKENYNKIGRLECAKILNRTLDSLSSKIRDCGLNLQSKGVWCESDLNFLSVNYEKMGVSYCCKKLEMNKRRVVSKANELGLKTNKRERYENKNKKTVKYNLFEDEFTKESVYILGLLWADGHINVDDKSTMINCVESDINDVIETFLKTGDWYISKSIKKYHNGHEVKNQKKLYTSTWGLFNILKKYGFINKSHGSPMVMINKIPKHLLKYWFRGFLDGDGCVRDKSIVFASGYEQDWGFMVNLTKFLGISYGIYRNKTKLGGYSHFSIHRKNDIIIFGEYIYSDYDNIGFKRKNKKYSDIKKVILNT